ncbi:hypothetical protein LQG66_08785 [Bradyrhizobium ontarionense]|uniref:Uncharacterized protein n=1 Tax=Bradyrhizobium ontarionense TaxID=2898149 RepID=A0ABY3RGD8_9BRAD|nr:hypothetical protein [Bradyrhizobium sp. A19]UFZ06373.1 hypothetical protein LQG66_08785 [Bradyrhizobium sp. A19]
MIIQIKAMCEANGSILAATSYDDSNAQDRTNAVIALLEQVLAHSDRGDDQRLFTLDIETASPASDIQSNI